jgi:hypothetical protein
VKFLPPSLPEVGGRSADIAFLHFKNQTVRRFFVKRFVPVVIVLVFCALSFAQIPSAARVHTQAETAVSLTPKSAAESASHRPPSSADCVFTFSSGADNTFLKFCVTATANVTVFESPAGQEHIAVGLDGEGYGVCDLKSGVAYFDYAERGDSGNWGQPTVVSQTPTSVKIARTTSDDRWTLTQTFTQVAGLSPSAKITMTLTNNTAKNRIGVLLRYADVDAAGVSLNNLDSTLQSAFGWNSVGTTNTPYGLVLQNLGNPPAGLFGGLADGVPGGPDPCNPAANEVSGPVTATDGSIVMVYELRIPASKSKTVTVRYRGF